MPSLKSFREFLDWVAYGKLVFDVIAAALAFKAIKAMLTSVTQVPTVWHGPIEWAGALLCFGLLLRYWHPKSTNSDNQTGLSVVSNALPGSTSPFDAKEFFRVAYYGSANIEAEKNFRLSAQENSPDDHASFYLKILSAGLPAYVYDLIWWSIYKSQLLALLELNRKNGILATPTMKRFYDQAVSDNAKEYANYSFDQWMRYLIEQKLVIRHPSEMVEITLQGKDFLKYLLHWGREPSQRPL